MKPDIHIMMKNELVNIFGVLITGTALYSNFIAWLAKVNINQFAALILTAFSVLYMIMKIYDQYLITKERKKSKKIKKWNRLN